MYSRKQAEEEAKLKSAETEAKRKVLGDLQLPFSLACQAAAAPYLGTELNLACQAAAAPYLGKQVKIHGLQAKPELNGRVGLAASYDDATGRYNVQLSDGSVLALQPKNLEPVTVRGGVRGGALCNNM